MNFNIIAILLAACVSMTAAVNTGKKDKLVSPPPIRHPNKGGVKRGGKHGKIVPSRPHPTPLQAISSSDHQASKVCARKLEGIIYAPSNNVKEYLAKIAAEIRADIQVIMTNFAAGNLDYIRLYVNKYNVLITVGGPFGLPVLVAPQFNAFTVPFKNVATSQNYVGIDGFYTDSVTQYYIYKFNLMSVNDQFITFAIALPLSAMTLTPLNDCAK